MIMAYFERKGCVQRNPYLNCVSLFILFYLFILFIFICHTHDYNNYKKVYQKKKCGKKWRGGLKETIELILIRPPPPPVIIGVKCL